MLQGTCILLVTKNSPLLSVSENIQMCSFDKLGMYSFLWAHIDVSSNGKIML